MAILLKQANTGKPAMGLETQGLQLFEPAFTTISVPVVGNTVYHGLTNESDISKVETYYGRKFTERPDLWGQVSIDVPHTVVPVDPNNAEHILMIGLLRFNDWLAPSLADEKNPNKNYKFVLYSEEKEAEISATTHRRKAAMIAVISEIDVKDPEYLITLARTLCNFSAGIKTKDQAMLKLSEFLDGKLSNMSVSECVEVFRKTLDPIYGGDTTKESLFMDLIVNDAITNNIIRWYQPKGYYYNPAVPDGVGLSYGRTKKEVAEFLSAISNSDHYAGSEYAVLDLLKNKANQKEFLY